ncbi:LapA family protein [Rhodobacteraceae bacterium CCMM004]|nr:LapA family protein [Rhodobacteraceae bacterium CCMM004]
MRYLRYAFLAALAVVLVVVALANDDPVTLRVLPEQMAGFLGWRWSATLPHFLVIFGAILAGILIGFVWEWLREHRHRVEARTQRREKEKLEREVAKVKETRRGKGDDVLALLEDGSAPR